MDQESIWQEFGELPPEAQRQVLDFIAFLHEHHRQSRSVKKSPSTDLAKETFIGIWSDREDLEDSSGWVRELRKHEWVRPRA